MIMISVLTLLYLAICCNIGFIWGVKYRGLRDDKPSSVFGLRDVRFVLLPLLGGHVRGRVRVLTFGQEVGVNLSFRSILYR